jgi:[ribosomal protein S18]-alanine N-acetyltransferase
MSLRKLILKPPQLDYLNQIVELDKSCLGGLWTLEGYQRELESPNSNLLILSIPQNPQQSFLSSKPSELSSSASSSSLLSQPLAAASVADEEKIIGCGCFWEILEEAHITLLMIHPDFQGFGLGQLLLYALLNDAVSRKLERATLEVRISNEAAIALYKKFGFQIAGRRKNYYKTTNEDALILWRGDLARSQFLLELETWRSQIGDRLTQNSWQIQL